MVPNGPIHFSPVRDWHGELDRFLGTLFLSKIYIQYLIKARLTSGEKEKEVLQFEEKWIKRRQNWFRSNFTYFWCFSLVWPRVFCWSVAQKEATSPDVCSWIQAESLRNEFSWTEGVRSARLCCRHRCGAGHIWFWETADELNQASPRCLLFQASKLVPHMSGVTMGAQNYKCNLKPQTRKAMEIEKW